MTEDPYFARLRAAQADPAALALMQDPELVRRMAVQLAPDPGYVLPSATVLDAEAPGPHGPVPVRVYRPLEGGSEDRPLFVWCHGGGWCEGDLDMLEADATAPARCTRRPVPSWCRSTTGSPRPACTTRSRSTTCSRRGSGPSTAPRTGEPPRSAPCSAVPAPEATWPRGRRSGCGTKGLGSRRGWRWSTQRCTASSRRSTLCSTTRPVRRRGWRRSSGGVSLENYLGAPAAQAPAYVVPATADPAGLPPTLVVTCEWDGLRSSGESYAEGLASAGVPHRLVVMPSIGHAHLNSPWLPQAQQTFRDLADWVAASQAGFAPRLPLSHGIQGASSD